MKRKSPHRGLELRLEVLRHRIRTLTEKMSRTEGIQKIENLAGIGWLERRYGELEQRLDELNREGPGFRHEIKNEFVKLSSDLSGSSAYPAREQRPLQVAFRTALWHISNRSPAHQHGN